MNLLYRYKYKINVNEGHAILDRKVDLRVVLKSIRCIQVIKKISGRTDI